jgi:hypothetical protein
LAAGAASLAAEAASSESDTAACSNAPLAGSLL